GCVALLARPAVDARYLLRTAGSSRVEGGVPTSHCWASQQWNLRISCFSGRNCVPAGDASWLHAGPLSSASGSRCILLDGRETDGGRGCAGGVSDRHRSPVADV